MRLAEIYLFFRNFRNDNNKFNNTGARMFDSIYNMTMTLLKNHIFGVKISFKDFAIF